MFVEITVEGLGSRDEGIRLSALGFTMECRDASQGCRLSQNYGSTGESDGEYDRQRNGGFIYGVLQG